MLIMLHSEINISKQWCSNLISLEAIATFHQDFIGSNCLQETKPASEGQEWLLSYPLHTWSFSLNLNREIIIWLQFYRI